MTAFISTATFASTSSSTSRTAPCTCGAQRMLYGSCTRTSPARWDSRIAEPRIRDQRLAAEARCPRYLRSTCSRGSNAVSVPRSASVESAAARSAIRARRRASRHDRASSEVIACVPLMRASPSFGPSSRGARPARRNPSAPLAARPPIRTCPQPSSGRARCASGARSPLAPTDPRLGTSGSTSARRRESSASMTFGRTPEWPRARVFARNSSIPRTASSSSGSPSPDAWLRISRRWSSTIRSPAMRTPARSPNPVFTPYTASPVSRTRRTAEHPASTRARAPAASAHGAPRRAIASNASNPSDSPSMTTGSVAARVGPVLTRRISSMSGDHGTGSGRCRCRRRSPGGLPATLRPVLPGPDGQGSGARWPHSSRGDA